MRLPSLAGLPGLQARLPQEMPVPLRKPSGRHGCPALIFSCPLPPLWLEKLN